MHAAAPTPGAGLALFRGHRPYNTASGSRLHGANAAGNWLPPGRRVLSEEPQNTANPASAAE